MYPFDVKLWFPITESAQIFFMAPCMSTLHSIFSDHMPHVHVGTCTFLFIKKFSQKTKKSLFSRLFYKKTKFSKLTFSGFRPPNRLNFFSWLRVCLLYVATCPVLFYGWCLGIKAWPTDATVTGPIFLGRALATALQKLDRSRSVGHAFIPKHHL